MKQQIMKLRENLNLSLFELNEVAENSKKCKWNILSAD